MQDVEQISMRQVLTDYSIILVELTFLRPEEGGRQHPSGPPFTTQYRPHLVVQSADVRQAVLQGKTLSEDYLGVAFLDGPDEYEAGEAGLFLLICMYSKVNYDALQVGATFTVREGLNHIVGFGTVLDRQNPIAENKNSTSAKKEKI